MLHLRSRRRNPEYVLRQSLLLLSLIVLRLGAQVPDFNFRQIGSEEGLNNPNIFNIEQHENGLMYFTTQNGIYHYDGYTFTRLRIDSLKSNALETAVIKSESELFLSVRGEGVAVYNMFSGDYELAPRMRVKDNNADQLIATEKYIFLLTTQVRLVIIDRVSNKIIADKIRKEKEGNLPNCIYRTAHGRVLVGRTDGIYDVTDGTPTQLNLLKGKSVFAITENKAGELFIGGSGVIYHVRGNEVIDQIQPVYDTKSTTFEPGGEKSISKIIADDFGRIWFSTFPGDNLYLYAFRKVYDVFDVLGIQPALINSMFMDAEKNIWIGTMSDGVYQIQNTFFHSFNFKLANKVLNINQVYLQGDLLVAATSNGLYGLNMRSNQTKTLSQPDPVFLEPVYSITESDGALFYLKRNELNMSPSIFLDSKRAYRFKPISARKFIPLSDGNSAVATWDGYIVKASADASNVTDTLISFTDYRISVNTLLEYNNVLYVGTNNGLFTYDLKTGKEENLVRSELNFSINDLAVINGSLFAAHDAGLTDVSGRRLIREAGDFPLNTVRKVRAYQDQIWIATLDGVFICDSNLKPLKILNKSNGLLSNSVNDISFDENRVCIATARGVSVTDFKNILRYNTRMKPVTISHLEVDGKVLRSANNAFNIAASARDISLVFFSPLFNKANTQYFRYRENGRSWTFFENLTVLQLSLEGGNHVIEICASADRITWSAPTTVVIEKEEKLTEKALLNWLVTLAGLLIIGLVAFLWVRRVKERARRRLTEEQQVNLLKHQAMNALLSPHFIFNSLTSIQNYINTNNSLRASEYLAKFSRLIRMIIEKAAMSHIALHDELARLTYYLELEKERFKNKFDYEISIDEDINTHEISIPNMIIQPYVENSILHGILPTHAPGKLWIRFKKEQARKLKIEIEDNGIGLIKAAEHAKTGHKSLGTSTIRSILEVNSKLTGKSQRVRMTDKSTVDPTKSGTIIEIDLEF